MSTTPITTAPVGHSLFDGFGGKSIWVRYRYADGRTATLKWALIHLQQQDFIFRADDGSTRWSFEGKTDEWGGQIIASIPDSQMPDGETFTEHHTELKDGKYRLPVITETIHAAHESASDHDVQSAITGFCTAETFVSMVSAIRLSATSAQLTTMQASFNIIRDCIDDLVKLNAKFAIEAAYTESVQHIGTPTPDVVDPQVEAAQAFADKWLAYFNAKPDADLGSVPRYAYNIRLRQELLKDATRTGDARFLIRRAVLVDALSSPLLAPEVTLDALFSKLKNLLTPPAEGS